MCFEAVNSTPQIISMLLVDLPISFFIRSRDFLGIDLFVLETFFDCDSIHVLGGSGTSCVVFQRLLAERFFRRYTG